MDLDDDFVVARTHERRLADGTRVVIRPIVPSDRDRLRAGFERLSPESRYRRFFTHQERLSDAQLRFLTEIDYVDHFAWAALAPDTPGSPGVGVARYVRIRDAPDAAEAAVAVADDLQGRGLGTLLLRELAAVARANGVRRFVSYVLADNEAMLGIFERARAHVVRDEPGVLRTELELPDVGELVDTDLHQVLRMSATGEHPVLRMRD